MSNELGITVVVDYAHTDDALRNLIGLARGHGRHGTCDYTVWLRRRPRPDQAPEDGRAAGEGSDLVVLTSDNPRGEDPMAIINEALVGLRETGTKYVVEADRAAAIDAAIRAARHGDIVLLAGKGHEKSQVSADGAVPFDDVAEAERVLRELGR